MMPFAIQVAHFQLVTLAQFKLVTYSGQRVAGVTALSSTLDKAPGVHEAVHHLADRPSETPSQSARCSRGIIGWSVTRSSVRFSDGLTPKAGAACAIRSGRGSDARFRLGDSVRSPPLGLPWALTSSSVWYELPTHENLRQRRRSRLSSASLVVQRFCIDG